MKSNEFSFCLQFHGVLFFINFLLILVNSSAESRVLFLFKRTKYADIVYNK